jgi:hypothetical protein
MKLSTLVCAVSVTFAGLVSLDAKADPNFGSKTFSFLLRPGQMWQSVPITFNQGEITQIHVVGDGDGDIDCYVTDMYGNIVGADNDSTDECIINVTPLYTIPFVVYVTNQGNVSDRVHGKVW